MGKSLGSSGSLPEGPVCYTAHRTRVATSWGMLINTGLFGVCERLAWRAFWIHKYSLSLKMYLVIIAGWFLPGLASLESWVGFPI